MIFARVIEKARRIKGQCKDAPHGEKDSEGQPRFLRCTDAAFFFSRFQFVEN